MRSPRSAPAARLLGSLFAVLLAAGSAAGQPAVQVAPLQTLDALSTGAGGAGLGPDLWQGASAPLLRDVLGALAQKPLSPAAAMLARQMLATGAQAPEGAASDQDLAAARALDLLALGDAPGAATILAHAPGLSENASLAQAAAESALILGDDDRACAVATALTSGRDGPYWLRLRTFCQSRAGDAERAQLTFSLALQTGKAPVFARLMAAKLSGAGAPGAASLRDGLEFALSRDLALDLAPALDAASPAVAAQVARTTALPPDVRIAAAARALRGALTLNDLFDSGDLPIALSPPSPPGSPDPMAVATSVSAETVIRMLAAKPGVVAEAGLAIQAVLAQTPDAKTTATATLLARAKSPADFSALARLARPAIEQLAHLDTPTETVIARAAVVADNADAARALRVRLEGDASELAVLDGAIAAAARHPDDQALGRLVERGGHDGPKSLTQSAAVLLTSLGGTLSADDRAAVAGFDVGLGGASPAKLALLRRAAAGGLKGETVLLALSIAADAGAAGLAVADRAAAVAALVQVGLPREAGALAAEGLVASR